MLISNRSKLFGFTIVELMVVIVVIGILSSISIVGFTGIQQRARDTARKSDISTLTKAIQIYNADNGGSLINSGCGGGTGGSGDGWVDFDFDAAGPLKSLNQCFVDGGQLQKAIIDPSRTSYCETVGAICSAYALGNCTFGTPSGLYLFATLESEPQNAAATNATCKPSWDTDFGFNYVVRVS